MTCRRLVPVALVAFATAGLAAPTTAPAKKKRLSLKTLAAKVAKDLAADNAGSTYKASCKAKTKRAATCTIVRTAGSGPACGKGTAKLTRRGRVAITSRALTDCGGIAGAPPATAAPVPGAAPAQVAAPPAPTLPPPPGPAAPAQPGLSGTFVCLTGIIAQVRPAGPTTIEPIAIPLTSLEPPLKFTLHPDGTYENVTFGAAYADDPKWKGTYTIAGDVVTLITSGGSNLVSYPFVRKTYATDTQYLIEDAPANEQYLANVCRAIG